MLFFIKKIVSAFLLPLPFGLLCILLAIILIIFTRAERFGHTTLILGFSIIFIFSLNPISFALLNRLQSQYSPLLTPPAHVNQIVVLGGGVSGGKNYPPNLMLNSASLSRLIEGIRLLKILEKENPNAQLILSGGRVFQSPDNAGKMRNTAVMLGIDHSNIALENGSQDTPQEALYLKRFVNNEPFILVTSAYHMPRAMDLFEKLNMHPIPAPTQFIGDHANLFLWCIPNANSLTLSNIALHEYLGILWEKLRGYIKK